MHICVLEDNPDILDCIRTTLEFGGHTVAGYLDGASLLEALLVDPPATCCCNLVITDLNLPGPLSGEDVVERIWGDSRCARLSIIVVTAATEQRIAIVRARFPALPIVRKPFHIDELIRCVDRARSVGVGC